MREATRTRCTRTQAGNNGMGWAGWAECVAGCLTNLRELRAGGAPATDFDLLALRPLTGLTALDVCDSQEVGLSTACTCLAANAS